MEAVVPELIDRKVGGDEVEALEMVWIRVGEDEDINLSYLLLPKERSDDILSNIETVVTKTSSINQHSLPFWEFDEDGVSVPDIDEGDP